MTATIKYLPSTAFDPTDIEITDGVDDAFLIKDTSGDEWFKIDTRPGTTNNGRYSINMAYTTGQRVLIGKPASVSQGPYSPLQVINQNNDSFAVRIYGDTAYQIDNQFAWGRDNLKTVWVHPLGGRFDSKSSSGSFQFRNSSSADMFVIDDDTNATFTLDETSGAVFKIVDDAASPNTYLKAVEAGSVSTERNFEIYNSTAPATSVTDGCILFCEDVSSSSELKVRDEAGNVTTLSPHNFSLIPEGASEEMAWSYYSEKNGKKINVDMLRLARLVEQISGEQIIFEEG